MKRASFLLIPTLLFVAALGCGGRQRTPTQRVMVPPRVDLTEHDTIGVVQFDSSSKDELALLATRRFTESARQDQGLVRIIEFGTKSDAPLRPCFGSSDTMKPSGPIKNDRNTTTAIAIVNLLSNAGPASSKTPRPASPIMTTTTPHEPSQAINQSLRARSFRRSA